MSFQNPYLLLLIIPFLGVFIFSLRKRQASLVVATERIFEGRNATFNRTKLPLLCYFLACIGLIIALARPQQGLEFIEDDSLVLDIILALDVSRSMEAFDIDENLGRNQIINGIEKETIKNRIEVAKKELLKFVENRPNDRLGLIVFAQTAFSSSPPTLEHDYLKEKIKTINTNILGEFNSATGIAAPIKSAINKLKKSPTKRRIMILFTDGENTVNDDITPEQAANIAKAYNIHIYTVGIGSDTAYIIQTNFFGRKVLAPARGSFNQKLLKNIADKTKAKYFHAKNQRSFEEAIKEIDRLEKVQIKRKHLTHYKEFYHYAIFASLLLLSLGSVLQMTISRKLP